MWQTHIDSSVANMLMTTFLVDNSNLVVMCISPTTVGNTFSGHLSSEKSLLLNICRQRNYRRLIVGMCMTGSKLSSVANMSATTFFSWQPICNRYDYVLHGQLATLFANRRPVSGHLAMLDIHRQLLTVFDRQPIRVAQTITSCLHNGNNDA